MHEELAALAVREVRVAPASKRIQLNEPGTPGSATKVAAEVAMVILLLVAVLVGVGGLCFSHTQYWGPCVLLAP